MKIVHHTPEVEVVLDMNVDPMTALQDRKFSSEVPVKIVVTIWLCLQTKDSALIHHAKIQLNLQLMEDVKIVQSTPNGKEMEDSVLLTNVTTIKSYRKMVLV